MLERCKTDNLRGSYDKPLVIYYSISELFQIKIISNNSENKFDRNSRF
jgi:hypothetical protein